MTQEKCQKAILNRLREWISRGSNGNNGAWDIEVQNLSDGPTLFLSTEVDGKVYRAAISAENIGFTDNSDPEVVLPEDM